MLYILLGVIFFSLLIYTQQGKWLINVLRNSVCGVAGILLFNILFSGLTVGINVLTVLIVGILGAPGFLLLYATRFLVQ